MNSRRSAANFYVRSAPGVSRAGQISSSRRKWFRMIGGLLCPIVPFVERLCAKSDGFVTFRDVAVEAGLGAAKNTSGAKANKQTLLEEMGGGVALFDYDNDGWVDIFLVNGTTLKGVPNIPAPTSYLFRNNRDGTFSNVTHKSGLTRTGWGQACCVGDFDNDGFDDLFVSYWGSNVLYRNNGDGTFTDVSDKAGVAGDGSRWGAGCCFIDYDRDGLLDLFVSNYVPFDPARAPRPGSSHLCRYGEIPVPCGPQGFAGGTNILYRNRGDGTFEDVSEKSGITTPRGAGSMVFIEHGWRPSGSYGMGVVSADFDNDGWPDIYVASDTAPSLLYRNNHDGTFGEVAVPAGCAFDENGIALSGMGVSAADYNGDGWLDIVRTNFSEQLTTVYRNNGDGTFQDASIAAGMGVNRKFLGFGVGFFDADNDGWNDIFIANGHVYSQLAGQKHHITYRQRRTLYRNQGNGRFADVSAVSGPAIAAEHAGRGCAFADLDNDGAVEIVVNNIDEAPSILRSESRPENNSLLVKCIGTRSNRSAIGTRVTVVEGGRARIDEVRSGSSYYSQNDFRLHFGLGRATKADRVEVRWPSGESASFNDVPANQVIVIKEGDGIVRREPLRRFAQKRSAALFKHAGIMLTALLLCAASPTPEGTFTDVTTASKIDFRHGASATSEKYLIETMGGGVALLDFDNDGRLDVFFVNGARVSDPMPKGRLPDKSAEEYWNRLYRQATDGTFVDVTKAAGLTGMPQSLYGMGVAVGDFDNDGFSDLYVTGYSGNTLYRNNGDSTFTDVTEQAGVRAGGWSSSAGFFDYDNDGNLDLFVGRYVEWDFQTNRYCGAAKPGGRAYCHPDNFKGVANILYHNNGDGTFTDVSRKAGIANPNGKALGVAFADYDGDGWLDIYVANDSVQCFLYRNNKNGTFTETSLLSGTGFNEDGRTFAGMGTDFADYDNDGWPDIVVTDLSDERYVLFRNNRDGTFRDATVESGLGRATLRFSGWSTRFFDYDNDGWKDLFVAQGHVLDTIEQTNSNVRYLQPPLLLRNRGGEFSNAGIGEAFRSVWAGRGAAFGDIDNDGDVDIVVGNLNQKAYVLRNEGGNRNGWITIQPVGVRSNRDCIGCRVRVVTTSGLVQHFAVQTAVGYQSASDKRLHVGLGSDRVAREVEVRWPSGVVLKLENVQSGRTIQVKEPAK